MKTTPRSRTAVAAVALSLVAGVCGATPSLSFAQEPAAAKPATEAPRKKNHLANEKSLYLLQHVENPVDWHPWGEEAFALAKKLDRPVFLSIGYSTCHWCHVMEEESFADEEVAKLLNETFVCIKVDREERPDVDNLYMTLCQLATGGGGWPLNVVLTPEKRPFYVDTYIPKRAKFGRAGLMDVVPAVAKAWKETRDNVEKQASDFLDVAKQRAVNVPGPTLTDAACKSAFDELATRYDPAHAGFGDGTKFPTPHQLVFLLRYAQRTGAEQPREMALATLRAMRRGGLFDHVGLGFHRYSTDPQWLVPHFEKMLYDQATLLLAYAEAYHLTRDEQYRKVCEEIVAYILRDMTTTEGMFASSEDADSDGEEGKFYVWTLAEFRTALGEDADFGAAVFNVEPDGNFVEQITQKKTGENILHLTKSLDELAAELKLTPDEFAKRMNRVRSKLYAAREKRIHPLKDDKVLTDWNGLMIAALARASWICERPHWQKAADKAADAVLTKLRDGDGKLLHRYRDGQGALASHLDDYAMLTWGLLELYEASFDVKRLEVAQGLTNQMVERFWDEKSGGLWYTASDAEELLFRQKEVYDGATPAGNSVALMNLLRLARITGDKGFEEKAESLVKAFSREIKNRPAGNTQFLQGVIFGLGPSYEIVVTGDSRHDDVHAMITALRQSYYPNRVVLLRREEQETPDVTRVAPFTAAQKSLKGQATAYVCRDHACNAPTTDVATMLKSLQLKKPAEPAEPK